VSTLIDPITGESRLVELEDGVVMSIPDGYEVCFYENGTLGALQEVVFGGQNVNATD